MNTLRLDFCDFYPGFRKDKNYFTDILNRQYKVEISEQPDALIYSNFGHRYRLYTCPRIFFSGESSGPNFRECDFAFTCRPLQDPRHLRLPLYVFYSSAQALIKSPEELEQLPAAKTKFCAFMVTNNRKSTRKRIDFFQRLSRYKKVDSGGCALNNIGGPIGGGVLGKLSFLAPYKFNIAFENRAVNGYTTEKITDAMRARCLPIYWGNSQIAAEFNPKSFLNYADFASEEKLIEKIIEIDRDEELYRHYLRQPFFYHNQPNEFFDSDRVLAHFEKILAAKINPVGRRREFFQFRRWIWVKKK